MAPVHCAAGSEGETNFGVTSAGVAVVLRELLAQIGERSTREYINAAE
jgi:hypothetical protein